MLENRVKKKIEQGEPAFGVYLGWPAPDLVEFFGYLGFEWLFIDAEHGVIDRESCEKLVRACNIVGLVPIVRVPENNAALILGYLETGVMGIITPHTNTAADAQAAVDAVRYNPLGKRGAGSGTRVANYGLTQTPQEYFHRANQELIVNVLVEEVEGIRNLDQILAVEGVDAVGIGPGDLSLSMGLPGQASNPQVRKMVLEAEARVVAAGKVVDAVVRDAAEARECMARGARLIALSAGALIGAAGRDFLQDVKR